MKLETASVTSSSGVFQDCQDPRVFLVSMGSWERKGTKGNQACTVSLGSQDSREPQASLDFRDPRESRETPEQ